MKKNNGFLVGLAAFGLIGLPAMAQSTSGQTGSGAPGQTSPGSSQTSPGTTRSGQSGSSTTTQSDRSGAATSTSKSKGAANRMAGDSNFLMKAAQGNLAEVQLGQLAKDKATDSSVKDFAQRMIDDHMKTLTEIQNMGGDKAVTIPSQLDAKHQAVKDRLSKLSGAAFDRAYMTDMVSDHREDVKEFEQHAKSGTDPDVKAFAAKTLPTLQEHLHLAEQIHAQLAGGAKKGESSRQAQPDTDRNENPTSPSKR